MRELRYRDRWAVLEPHGTCELQLIGRVCLFVRLGMRSQDAQAIDFHLHEGCLAFDQDVYCGLEP